MVYSEATLAMPLVAGYVYHKGAWKNRKKFEFQKLFQNEATTVK
jgi:deoxyhypusine synthase